MTTQSRLPSMLAVGAITCAVALACCAHLQAQEFSPPDPSSIDAGEVHRIISVLADDDMRGRRAFTEDAERAAAFLAREFEAAGLEPLGGLQSYLQHFAVYSLQTESSRVVIDGVTLGADQVMVRAAEASLSWSTGDAPVVVVGPEDSPQEKVFPLLRGGGNALVLMHPQHQGMFTNLARFFGGASRSLEAGAGGALVLALVDASADATYEVEASATIREEPLMNVVGMIPGRRNDEFVLFSAHYDHIGIRPPVDGDSIANGANDDASGTTAVVILARYFAQRGTPERALPFAAFTRGEGGGPADATGWGVRPLQGEGNALKEVAAARPVRASAFPDGLTQREIEVLGLVTAGKMDREIAEALFISVNTVGNHVRSILNKTNAANRAEAAAYAVRRGLAPDEDSDEG